MNSGGKGVIIDKIQSHNHNTETLATVHVVQLSVLSSDTKGSSSDTWNMVETRICGFNSIFNSAFDACRPDSIVDDVR